MAKVYTSEKSKRYKGLDVRVGVLVSTEQRDWLQAQSASTGIPLTAIVRRAIDAYRQGLARKTAKRPAVQECRQILEPPSDPVPF